jgi:hypothetical protein
VRIIAKMRLIFYTGSAMDRFGLISGYEIVLE